MKISVVIGAYNQRDTLELALQSLFKQSLSPQEYEIIVVDSFSNDGTDAMIENLKPTCRLDYVRRKNRGKASARNFGIFEAKSDIILLTDADMVADYFLLMNHVKTHEKQGNCAVEGNTLNLKRLLPPEELTPQHPDTEPYIKEKIRPFQKLKWAYFLSGNLSVPKKALMKAGCFDQKFSEYGWEDIELGYRLSKQKLPLIFNSLAVNYHYHIVDRQNMLKRKYNMGKSAAYFYKKHRSFGIKMFLGINPLAMGIFHVLKRFPKLRAGIKNQYIQEEYQYRLGLTEGLN